VHGYEIGKLDAYSSESCFRRSYRESTTASGWNDRVFGTIWHGRQQPPPTGDGEHYAIHHAKAQAQGE
jgi:hypothetical protein